MAAINMTMNGLAASILSQLMRVDPSNPLGQQILNYFKQSVIPGFTGISPTSPLWNATLYSNMTDFGRMMQNMNASANAIGMQQLMQMRAGVNYEFYEGIQRTLVSEAAFRRMRDRGQTGGITDYQKFIEHKAQGMMDSPVLSTLMTMTGWDPTGKMMAAYNLKEASANIARTAMWRGDENYARKAEAIADLFLDDKNQLSYSRMDYGGLTMNETTQLTAMLTKGMVLEGRNEQELEQSVKKLRQHIQGLSQAMAPLKDIFGDDIPNMVKFLEDISGKSIKQLDGAWASRLSSNVMNGILTGAYTAEQYVGLSGQLQHGLSQIGVPYYLETGASALTDRILAAVNAGSSPLMMTQASYRQAVADRTMRQAASPFANNANLAYGIWAANHRGGDTSIEAFRAEFERLRGSMNEEQALLRLSGASSIHQLASLGTRYGGYSDAVREGLGADLASVEGIRRRATTIVMGQDTPERRRAMQEVINAYMSTSRTQTVDDLDRYFAGLANSTGFDQLKYQAAMELQQNWNLRNFNVDMRKYGEQYDDALKRAEAGRRRELANKMSGWLGAAGAENTGLMQAFVRVALSGFKELPDMAHRASIEKFMEWGEFTPEEEKLFQAFAQANGTDEYGSRRTLRQVQSYIANRIEDPSRNDQLHELYNRYGGDMRKFRNLAALSGNALSILMDKDVKIKWGNLEGLSDDEIQHRLKEQALQIGMNKSDGAYGLQARKGALIEALGGDSKYADEIIEALALGDQTVEEIKKSDTFKKLSKDKQKEAGKLMDKLSDELGAFGLNDFADLSTPEQLMAKAFGDGGVFQTLDDTLTGVKEALTGLTNWLTGSPDNSGGIVSQIINGITKLWPGEGN